jgi:hypothetical protein
VHVHKILENLLEWSRLQRRSFEYRPELINLTALIRDVLEMNSKEAVRKDIAVSFDLPETLNAYADKYMVTIILQNLMSNALNFTPSSGKINITGRIQDSSVIVSIADNGIGIANEDLPKLFRIDVHPAKIGSAESKGAGLGLVICKEMIQRCHGDITIESQLSRGTTVIFNLPVSENPVTDEMPQPDFVAEIKEDLKKTGPLPESFVSLCTASLLPRYTEVRSVLSLEHLSAFAQEVENLGQTYNISSFSHFGNYLASLVHTHKIDKILKVLPEFKKMTDTFIA